MRILDYFSYNNSFFNYKIVYPLLTTVQEEQEGHHLPHKHTSVLRKRFFFMNTPVDLVKHNHITSTES